MLGHKAWLQDKRQISKGKRKDLTLEELALIHERKTGRLIRYALLAVGFLAEQPEEVLVQLQQIAAHLGLAFSDP